MRRICGVMVLLAAAVPSVSGAEFIREAKSVSLRPPLERVVFVPVAAQAPTLDGKLDDAAWKDAAVVRGLGRHPTGAASDADTEFRVTRDEAALYVSWTMNGTKNLKLKKPREGRPDDYGDAVLEMFIDPEAQGKTKVQIVTNPVGLRYDGWNNDKSWHGTWKSAGTTEENTWNVEVAIPVADLKTKFGDRPAWRANFGITYQDDDGEHMHSWTSRWGDPATDYGVLYFAGKEAYEAELKPRLSIYLDRQVYDLRDTNAVALARLDAARLPVDSLAMNVSVRQGDKSVLEQALAKLPGPDVDMTLDLSSLAPGDYTLNVDVLQQGKSVVTSSRPFTRKDRAIYPAAAASGRVPVKVAAQKDLSGIVWPITTGVPFAHGSLPSADHVRLLDAAGKEVPVQTSVRSTWNRGSSVQWLGLDFIPTLADGEQVYTLEYGPSIKAAAATPLKVEQTDDQISVNTGPMQFTVSRKQFAMISTASINGKAVIAPRAGAGLILVDHEGNRYVSTNDRQVQVVVEEQGPVRTTIKATGWYVKEGSDGSRTSIVLPTDRLCQFTVRLSAFAGSTLIKAAVSTTVTFDSNKVRISELTIGLPVEASQLTVGSGDKPIQWTGNGYVLQDRWDHSIDASGAEHPRADGWIEAKGANGDVLVAMRRFWQLFPKEVGYRDGVLTMHPWPAHGHKAFKDEEAIKLENIYKLWWAHEGKELDFRLPAVYKKALDEDQAAKATEQSAYYTAMTFSNAQGLTIHNDLLIALRATQATDIQGDTLSKLANVEPHAMADPVYACGTGAMGPILAAEPEFAALEETVRRGFEHLSTRSRPNNEYGMFITGNMHTYWTYHTKPVQARLHRVWMNGHYQIARLPFIQYIRTGDPTWMGWGRDHANTLRDIAMVNYVSDEKAFAFHTLGSMYHCKGFAPWAGDGGSAQHPLVVDFLAYDYLINGNGRSRDVLNNWIEGVLKISPGGYGTREGINPMSEMLAVYQLTWNPGFIELIERFRTAIFAQPLTSQGWWDYNSLLFPRDYYFTGSPQTLAAYREAREGSSQSYGGMAIYDGLLAMIDNDSKRLAPWPAQMYQQSIGVINRPGEYGDGMTDIDWMGFAYATVKYPYLLKAMKQAGLGIERPKLTTPAPIAISGKQTLLAVQETSDSAIPVTLATRRPPEKELLVRIFRGDGTEVAKGTYPAVARGQPNTPLKMEIPADGQAGQYLIVIERAESYDNVLWPVTNLEHEVAILPANVNTVISAGDEGVRLYATPKRALSVRIHSDSKPAMGMEILDANDKVLATASSSRHVGGWTTLNVPSGAKEPLSWYFSGSAYMTPEGTEPLIVALNPKALFSPSLIAAPEPVK